MSPRFGRSTPLSRYESKASELNGKFESDYKDCLNVLETEKRDQEAYEGEVPIANDIPPIITAPTDAASQLKMLRRTKSKSNSSNSNSTTTQKMFMASSENGIVVTSNMMEVTKTMDREQNSSFGTGGSTLPTFLSVGASIDNLHQNDLRRNDSLFIVSKERSNETPLLTLVSLEANSWRGNNDGVRNTANLDRETRKQLHYKDKLKHLTDSLITSVAVERSRRMLSNIADKGGGIVAEANTTNHARNNGNNTTPDPHDNENDNDPRYKRILDGIRNKLYACSMRICVDEAVIDHEGIVIDVPTRAFACRCTGDDTGGDDNEENHSEISSLTGVTPHRFQSRYWIRDPENEHWV